jgi:hypothetical protein
VRQTGSLIWVGKGSRRGGGDDVVRILGLESVLRLRLGLLHRFVEILPRFLRLIILTCDSGR